MGLTRHILNCGQEKSRFFQYKYIELIDKKATFFQDCPSLSNFSLGVQTSRNYRDFTGKFWIHQ